MLASLALAAVLLAVPHAAATARGSQELRLERLEHLEGFERPDRSKCCSLHHFVPFEKASKTWIGEREREDLRALWIRERERVAALGR
jgi:hypothetical protein